SVGLTNVKDGSSIAATYLEGRDGVVTNPVEPALPLEVYNIGVSGTVLRGVGFREGTYADTPNVLPLTGAPTTEIRGVHIPFQSDVFYPVKPWSINYFDALARADGTSRLLLTPAQYVSATDNSQTTTQRHFTNMGFRLYYSDHAEKYGDVVPALAAPPYIAHVAAEEDGGVVTFKVNVAGHPAAGIQGVWVTYTATSGLWYGKWQSLDLVQSPDDSTLWQGTIPLPDGTAPGQVRYMAQAVNGVGLVSLDTNLGEYYIVGIDPGAPWSTEGGPPPEATTLEFLSPPQSAPYGTTVPVRARLTSSDNVTALGGRRLSFSLQSQRVWAITNDNGEAEVTLSLLGMPGTDEIVVSYAGEKGLLPTSATTSFTVTKQETHLTLEQSPTVGQSGSKLDPPFVVTLTDALGRRLLAETVFFIVTDGLGNTYTLSTITNHIGQAFLDEVPLPPGTYSVAVHFSGEIQLPSGTIVTLNDVRYMPTSMTDSLIITGAPEVDAGADATVDEGSPFTGSGSFTDSTGTSWSATVDYGDGSGVQPLSLANDKTFALNHTYGDNADYTVTVCITNNHGDEGCDSLAVKVNNVSPTINSISTSGPVGVGVPVQITVSASDPAGDNDPLSYAFDCDNDGVYEHVLDTNTGSCTFHSIGSHTVNVKVADDDGGEGTGSVVVEVLGAPVCDGAEASPSTLWSGDHSFYPISILGVTDPDGDTVTITIDAIWQDEPVNAPGSGNTSPDGKGVGTSTAEVRAERMNSGDGRVYHIDFTASDGKGGSCTDEVLVSVPKSANQPAIDGGRLYDSTTIP
ncbi:MAG: PKD domain-containing protein, partial [Chloroflexota bacterium]|nr:PKD domain-containing protein [Chloroflexota bacterium]